MNDLHGANNALHDEDDQQYDDQDQMDQDDAHNGHNQEYEINFDEVNEDDDIELLYAKLRASKKARMRADEDAKLLENRIKLLKQEEAKARKKINETKKRAKDIIGTKKRNVEKQKKKVELRSKREQEENKLAVRNENLRSEIKEKINNRAEEIRAQKVEEARRLKQEKKEQEEMLNMYKQQEQLKNTSLRLMITNNEAEASEKRKRDYAEKKAIARSHLDEKVLRENQRRIAHEEQVARMEQEELELIQRLQNTQWIQKAAYEDLEQALAGEDIDLEKLEALQRTEDKKTKPKKKTKAK